MTVTLFTLIVSAVLPPNGLREKFHFYWLGFAYQRYISVEEFCMKMHENLLYMTLMLVYFFFWFKVTELLWEILNTWFSESKKRLWKYLIFSNSKYILSFTFWLYQLYGTICVHTVYLYSVVNTTHYVLMCFISDTGFWWL